jgi:carbon-monoxide dehydrogenase medium subunit
LQAGEIVRAVRVPKLSAAGRFGYFKACRKPGEFAHAMAAFCVDPARGLRRLVIGATGARLIVLDGEAAGIEAAQAALMQSGLDAVGVHMQVAAVRRAMDGAG